MSHAHKFAVGIIKGEWEGDGRATGGEAGSGEKEATCARVDRLSLGDGNNTFDENRRKRDCISAARQVAAFDFKARNCRTRAGCARPAVKNATAMNVKPRSVLRARNRNNSLCGEEEEEEREMRGKKDAG